MRKATLFVLWSCAAVAFAASLGLGLIAWSWMMWGAEGDLSSADVRPIYILIFISPFLSAAIGTWACRVRSRAVWPPVVILLLLPLVFAVGLLTGD